MCRSSPVIRHHTQSQQIVSNAGLGWMRTFPIEKLRTVLATKHQRLWHLSHQLHDLSYMVVVFTVSRTRRGVKQVVASRQKLEYLQNTRMVSPAV